MKNYKNVIIALIFLIVFFLLLIKLPFTFIADDSPETITCFNHLLIQHPPGYPIDTLSGKLFSLIPIGNIMMKANLLSIFFHILSSLVLFFCVLKILRNENEKFSIYFTSMLAVIFYLFSNTTFIQAMSAKGSIYTMHSFFTAVIFYCLLNIKKGYKYFYLISFIYGLALTNHWPSAVVMLPSIAVYLFLLRFKLNLRKILNSILFFIIGLTPFLLLFIRTSTNPDILWPVKDLKDFFWLIARKQYAGIDTGHTVHDTIVFLKYLFTDILPKQYPFFLIFLSLPGIIFLFKYHRIFSISTFLIIFFMISGIASVNIMKDKMEWVVKPYLTFIYLFISVYISFFFFKIITLIKNLKLIKIFSGVIFILIFIFLYRNCPDYSKYFLAYDYVQNIFRTLPYNSFYFAQGDLNVAGGIYATEIEKKNVNLIIPSLLMHKWYRDLLERKYKIKIENNFSGYKNCIRNIILLNPDKKFYYSNTYTENWIDFFLIQRGLVYEISMDFNKTDIKNYYLYFKNYVYRGAFDKISYDDSTKTFVLRNFGMTWYNAGKIFESKNERLNILYYFTRAFNFYKDDIIAYKIGLYYYDNEEMEKSIYYLKEAVKINKKNIPAYRALIAHGVIKNDYNMMRKYAKEILKYDRNNVDAINLLNEIGR